MRERDERGKTLGRGEKERREKEKKKEGEAVKPMKWIGEDGIGCALEHHEVD